MYKQVTNLVAEANNNAAMETENFLKNETKPKNEMFLATTVMTLTKTKVLLVLFLVLFNVSLFAQGVTPVKPEKGTGKPLDPYLIETLANLRWVSENSSNTWWGSNNSLVYYKQTANIDASETAIWNGGVGFKSIGNGTSINGAFWGVYDGDGNTISNLHIASTSSYIGLFGVIRESTIQNVHLVNVNITSNNTSAKTGALVGQIYFEASTIIDCSVSGNISGYASDLGGLVGYSEKSFIAKCSSKVNINTSDYDNMRLGGLVGTLDNSRLINSYFYGNLQYNAPNPTSTIQQYKGGLVGYVSSNSTITFCYVTSSIEFSNTIGGGIVGTISNNSIIANSFWNTETTQRPLFYHTNSAGNNANAIGFNTTQMKQQSSYSNYNFNANFGIWNINSSTNDGYPHLRPPQTTTQAIEPAGAGTASNPYQISTLANLRWVSGHSSNSWWGSNNSLVYYKQTANIDASETAIWNGGEGFKSIGNGTSINGAFWGVYDGDGKTISNLHIASTSSYIGLFGVIRKSTIQNVHLANVIITSNNTSAKTGALVGQIYFEASTIIDCSVSGNISGYASDLGGLVGYSEKSFIAKSSSKVNINTSNDNNMSLGGLVGTLTNSSKIQNSYFYGNLNHIGTTTNNKGGLVGSLSSISTINMTYVASTEKFTNIGGGMVGNLNSGCSISNSYWDTQTTEKSIGVASGTGTNNSFGRLTAEMKTQSNYTEWDFTNIWNKDPANNINNGYPFLIIEHWSEINENLAQQIQIYPNPATSEIFIQSELQIEKVEVYSLTGGLLILENNFKEKISVSTLSSGIYFLKIHTKKGLTVRKIVKE